MIKCLSVPLKNDYTQHVAKVQTEPLTQGVAKHSEGGMPRVGGVACWWQVDHRDRRRGSMLWVAC